MILHSISQKLTWVLKKIWIFHYTEELQRKSESAMKKGKKKTKHRQWNDREMLAEIIGVVIDVINMEIF